MNDKNGEMENEEKQNEQTERRLLVPMNIEALVIGETAETTEWGELIPNFKGVKYNQFLGQQLETDPCSTTTSNLYEPGIHLHWALPDGLSHGVQEDDDGGPEFPLIPNRWLIVRLWDQEKAEEKLDLQSKSWIVESDTITDNKDGVVWPTQSFENLKKLEKKEDYYVHVGKQFEMTSWTGETSEPRVNITAVGYGDPSFAAYYPACRGILGFHDKDIEEMQNISLTYFVAGWYADPSTDPLHRALTEKTFKRLDEFLAERKWTYSGLAEALDKIKNKKDLEVEIKEAREMLERIKNVKYDLEKSVTKELQKKIAEKEGEIQTLTPEVKDLQKSLPGQILCHGVISDIQWKGKDTRYNTSIPRDKPLSVSLGNTAVEALSALFRDTLKDEKLVKLLEVFQYDLLSELEKPGGVEKVEHKIHERTFRPLSRGILWDLVQEKQHQAGDPSHEKTSSIEEKTPPIPGVIRVLLENLNNRQRQINRLKRERDSVRSQLYATWYKRVLNTAQERVGKESLDKRLEDLQKEIAELTGNIDELVDERGRRPIGPEWDQLDEKLHTLLPGYKLQQLEEPRFWRPNDPTLLLAGQPFQRSSRHGEDGRYRTDERLLCRLSGQVIAGIKITIPHAVKENIKIGSEVLDKWCNPFKKLGKLPIPSEVANLFRESLLLTLDSKRAHIVAVAAYEKNEKGLAEDHSVEVKNLANYLINEYLKEAWEDARNPDVKSPKLRETTKNENDENKHTTVLEFVGTFPSPIMMNRWEKNPWLPLSLQWQVSWTSAYTDTQQALKSWNLTGQGTAFEWKGKSPNGNGLTYTGKTLLTSSAALNFSDRLRQYNLTHENPKLKTFQTAVSSMNLLCQNLGGLTENLLMRKSRLELEPLEPGNGDSRPRPSHISDQVKDVEWLSPLTDSQFFPVRAGHFKLEKLWVIDAFGQLLKLEDLKPEEKSQDGTVSKPYLPERLIGVDGYVRLEPRLAQPVRLTIQWPPASRWDTLSEIDTPLREDEEFSTVCGWILPNFLDNSLMIYDAQGNALGALQTVQRKSWAQGVGAQREEIESFHWVDIPGSEEFFFGKPPKVITDPLGEGANPHLREFVKGLLALTEGGGHAFGQLLEKMNETLSSSGGSGSGQDPNLALLIGRPIALVRARVRLELDGQPAHAQGWGDLETVQTGSIEKVKFPIRLGDQRKWNDVWLGDDGLVGFFLKKDCKIDYTQFYPAYGLNDNNNSYIEYNKVPEISVSEPLDLTLLMDVSRGICATTGILPRTIFHLPYGDLSETLENKQVVFFTGPVVSPESEKEIRMPRPSDIYGQWSWTHHPEVKVWREESITDLQTGQGQCFDRSLQIAEGWMKLMTAPLEIRVFKVKGKEPVKEEEKPKKEGDAPQHAQFEVSPGETIILSWTAIGAEEIELRENNSLILKSNLPPLPTQYRISVEQDTSFTLISTGRAEKSPKAIEQPEKMKKTIDIKMLLRRSENVGTI